MGSSCCCRSELFADVAFCNHLSSSDTYSIQGTLKEEVIKFSFISLTCAESLFSQPISGLVKLAPNPIRLMACLFNCSVHMVVRSTDINSR